MDSEQLIVAMLADLPNRALTGKKRLQKLSYLMISAGVQCPAKFYIHDFGPFSTEVARSVDLLTFIGLVTESKQEIPPFGIFATIYHLSKIDKQYERLDTHFNGVLNKLNKFSTIDLEVAATVRFLMETSLDFDQAWAETSNMKPTKTSRKALENSKLIMSILN